MARTLNGNLTGRAAHKSIDDLLAESDAARRKLELDLGDAMNELRTIDPQGWERWYDVNIPRQSTYAEILTLVQARIALIRERAAVAAYEASLSMTGKHFTHTGILNARAALGTKPLPAKG